MTVFQRFGPWPLLVLLRLMANLPPSRLTDEEYERLLNDGDEVPVASQGPESVQDALDAAYQALEQRTGAMDQESQETNGAVTGEAVRSIWGSSLQVSHVMKRVMDFIRRYKKESAPLGSDPHYIRVLQQVRILISVYNIFCNLLLSHLMALKAQEAISPLSSFISSILAL